MLFGLGFLVENVFEELLRDVEPEFFGLVCNGFFLLLLLTGGQLLLEQLKVDCGQLYLIEPG